MFIHFYPLAITKPPPKNGATDRTQVYLTALLVFCWLCPLYGSSAIAARADELRPSIGLNKFDLLQQYLGTTSGGDGSDRYRKVTQAMGRKAIRDAHDIGVTYLRLSVAGWKPSVAGGKGDLDLWVRDPQAHWRIVDQMIADLDANQVKIVPVFAWHVRQFPAMEGGTVASMVTDPNSPAYLLLKRYVTEFVTRYRTHPTVFFYELTNELDLDANLDLVARCLKRAVLPTCSQESNFTTADVVAFTSRLAALIRQLDPSRAISSGFAVPRRSAESLRRRPEWSAGGANWASDSREDFEKNLVDIHKAVDIVSVHLYPGEENRRFGAHDEIALLDLIKEAADKAGKQLFVGEFGDPHVLKGEVDTFSKKVMDRIVALQVPYSAVWAWEFYQSTTYETNNNPDTASSLEPGVTDQRIAEIQAANRMFGNPSPPRTTPDVVPPNVVLTWPLECTLVTGMQKVCAVASDDSGTVAGVEIWVAAKRLASLAKPPYCFDLKVDELPRGEMPLVAKAVDRSGNFAESTTTIIVRAAGPDSRACPPTAKTTGKLPIQ